MTRPTYILAHDVGTTGSKSCLYRIGDTIEQVAACMAQYPLYMTDDGGAEQVADDWWQAVCRSTRKILYHPDPTVRGMFDRQYRVFTGLYRSNRKSFAALNRKDG